MLHVRVTVIRQDPLALGECVKRVETGVRRAVEGQPGNLGMSLLASPESGTVVLETFWVSRDALEASAQAAEALHGQLAGEARAGVTDGSWQVSVFEVQAPLHGGEHARLTRIQVRPSATADVIETFGDTAVPLLAETPGFIAALLFADPHSGHLISQSVWQDPQARAASPSTAALIRADVLESADCVIQSVEDYILVFSSARHY